MASLACTFRPLVRSHTQIRSTICARCCRSFHQLSGLQAGHNKWSKIKHEKAANDAKKTQARTRFSDNISLYSKLYGPDPSQNPQLATAIATARKAGMPKDRIEKAIARGQGKSSEGVVLESMTFEAMRPPAIAIIVDVETDSKLRVLQDLKQILKLGKATQSASKFFFTRAGRVVFEKSDQDVDVDTVMDDAIEAGAEDLETDEDGNIVIWTSPTNTTQMCHAVGNKFGLKVLSSGIVWSSNKDTEVQLDPEPWLPELVDMLAALRDYPDVQAVYANLSKGTVPDEIWARIDENLDR
ncbi:transcriptional regulator TACO1-like protein [Echria macrotheca]|uniref:Transcriptional regulator TACO1-like protein n=1 Tax=Echria macrotheca TaxID=438768 RepID=A0AAJ0B7H0_9PEZI|nr:transcriptional regulator TACO1-like protein [Echria macrotheca]